MATLLANRFRTSGQVAGKAAILLLLCGIATFSTAAADVPITEQQIKALCLFNFTKYVEWPAQAFATPETPIRIGVVGDKKITATLRTAVFGKTTGLHPIEVVDLDSPEEATVCQVVFLAGSDNKRSGEILAFVKGRNILTVGENEQFTHQGGIITFTRRENKVQFEVNLAAAHSAGLQISSKMLSLADAVRGKE